ncbi:MAG: peptidoglycan-binding domain-containing protein, partial [Rhodospirillaceae bacterium]
APAPSAASNFEAEKFTFEAAMGIEDPALRKSALEGFLASFPNSPLAPVVSANIQAAEAEIAAASAPQATTPAPATAPPAAAPTEAPAQTAAPTVPAVDSAAAQAAERQAGLGRGDRRSVQTALAALGYNPGPADGVFGGGTRAAIGAWQSSVGQPASGYISRAQFGALMTQANPALAAQGKSPLATTPKGPEAAPVRTASPAAPSGPVRRVWCRSPRLSIGTADADRRNPYVIDLGQQVAVDRVEVDAHDQIGLLGEAALIVRADGRQIGRYRVQKAGSRLVYTGSGIVATQITLESVHQTDAPGGEDTYLQHIVVFGKASGDQAPGC